MDCLSSTATTTASFGVDVHVVPVLVGSPLSFRAKPVAQVTTFPAASRSPAPAS